MKIKQTLLLFAALVVPASAAVTLNTQFGSAFNSSGVAVADGTLWALVVDTNNDGIFTGFSNNGSLAGNAAAANTFFTGNQSLSLGTVLNGNTVFALGGFNAAGPGITADTVVLNYGTNGTAAALSYAFYWFPGATYSGPGVQTIGSQVGGLNTTSNNGIFDAGMVLPNDGSLISTGAANVDGGGTIPDATFQAVNLTVIPEPSAALLGAIGALGLLRRRRN